MNKQLLTIGSLMSLALVGLLLTQQQTKFLNNEEPKQTLDFLQLCVIRSCYTYQSQCLKDQSCFGEFDTYSRSLLSDYTQYDTIIANATNPTLKAFLQCQNDCGMREYVQDCGQNLAYIGECASDKDCIAENQDYFDNVEDCSSREFKACNGLVGDAQQICLKSEQVFCFSDGISGSNTKFEDALLCV